MFVFCDQIHNSQVLYPKYTIVTFGRISRHVLSQAIENKAKTNHPCRRFPMLGTAIAPSSDWSIVLTVCVVIGQIIIILLWFWFYDTQLKTNL